MTSLAALQIYKEGAVAAADGSHDWSSVMGESDREVSGRGDGSGNHGSHNMASGGIGEVNLNVDGPGTYYVTMFCCGGYVELSPRVVVQVAPHPLNMQVHPVQTGYGAAAYVANTAIAISFSGAEQGTDWVGMYELGDVPGDVGSHDWSYHKSPNGAGNVQLTPSHPGDYYVVMLVGGGYVEASQRVPITVTCGVGTIACAEAPASCYTECRQ